MDIDTFLICLLIGGIGGFILRSYQCRKMERSMMDFARSRIQEAENQLEQWMREQKEMKEADEIRSAQQKKHNQQMKRRRG